MEKHTNFNYRINFSYRIKIEHNYHGKGKCRISAYNLTSMRTCKTRYVDEGTDLKGIIAGLTETIEAYWDGRVVQVIEN